MRLRLYKIFAGLTGVLVVASFLVAMHKKAEFVHNPKAYDARDGYTVPLPIRGTGTVYLTAAEAQSLYPYIYAQYAALALMAISLGGSLLNQRYRGKKD